jgi:hypothetical protein
MTRDDFDYCVKRFKEEQCDSVDEIVCLENFTKRLLATAAGYICLEKIGGVPGSIFKLEDRK